MNEETIRMWTGHGFAPGDVIYVWPMGQRRVVAVNGCAIIVRSLNMRERTWCWLKEAWYRVTSS